MTFLNKDLILTEYDKSGSYTTVANLFNTSRQRIHQIVTGYISIGSLVDVKVYNSICQRCGKRKSINIHHVDGNSHNNGEKNLISVCRRCHSHLHRDLKEGKINNCHLCGCFFTFRNRGACKSPPTCRRCYEKNYINAWRKKNPERWKKIVESRMKKLQKLDSMVT